MANFVLALKNCVFFAVSTVDCVGEKLWEVQCDSPTFTVAWHPKRPLLAYACDDKEGKYDNNREAGTVKLFGLPNDSWDRWAEFTHSSQMLLWNLAASCDSNLLPPADGAAVLSFV